MISALFLLSLLQNVSKLPTAFLRFPFVISIGNSMICSVIWHKYHEGYFEIVRQF